MFKFGLELELFYRDDMNIIPPPHGKDLPLDAFAGLVELRSNPSYNIFDCYGEVVAQRERLQFEKGCVLETRHEHQFNSTELAYIRRNRAAAVKNNEVEICNLYGRKPKLLKRGLAIASLQVNISNELTPAYTKDNVHHKAQYGLLDIPHIVKNLDKAFESEISKSKRQPGCYAIKDGYRLEYRSLPNFSCYPAAMFKIHQLFSKQPITIDELDEEFDNS